MLFAKTKDAERNLHQMFRFRQVRKVYRALTPKSAEPILRGSVFRWRDVLDWRGHEQAAATTAIFEGPSGGQGCWTVLPHTGRPHQIRKHFARYLVPLWGDRVYAPGVYGSGELLGLTCVAYRFRHPITFELLRVQLRLG